MVLVYDQGMDKPDRNNRTRLHVKTIGLGAIFTTVGGLIWEKVAPSDSSLSKSLRIMSYAVGGAVGGAVYSLFLRIENEGKDQPAEEQRNWQESIKIQQQERNMASIAKG